VSQQTSSTSTGGIGFVGLLTIVFIFLKLAGIGVVATWSWWWVLSPLWIAFGLWIIIILVAFIIFGIVALLDK
jgi:membrane protein YdbS with pleckstrin-like domain